MAIYDENEEETSFDDVAMSLLLFFLVMSVVSSAAGGLFVLRQWTVIPPQKASKTKKIFGDHDVSINVDAENNIAVRAIGGGRPLTFTVAADTPVETEDPDAGVIYTETSDAALEIQEKVLTYMAPSLETIEKGEKPVKLLLTATPDSPLGIVYTVRYAAWLINRAVAGRGGSAEPRVSLVPCPALQDAGAIDKVATYNECIEGGGGQGACEAKVDMKKTDLKKRFCDLKRLLQG